MFKITTIARPCFLGIIMLGASACQGKDAHGLRFGFGKRAVAAGYTSVAVDSIYSAERGHGFESGSANAVVAYKDYISGTAPFLFSVALPEGHYLVKVVLGGSDNESITTVKAETRRLMLEEVHTPVGQFASYIFAVNIRTPEIKEGGAVRLKDREKPNLHWDDKLTLEFNGEKPCVAALEILPADNLTTLYIAGDSTVCDQSGEPWNSWGQMITRFFKPDVVVANHAMSGESIRSSLGARRFDKVFSTMKSGDYLFIQYGHNDMKSKDPDKLEIYRNDLKDLVAKTRKRGATPVLITSMERKSGVKQDTLAEYPDIVRSVAKDEGVALIDLHAMSKVFYTALGGNLSEAFVDGTHHNAYGSYELARCVIEGIRENKLPIAASIPDDVSRFDPSKPDDLSAFAVPASPVEEKEKPLGN